MTALVHPWNRNFAWNGDSTVAYEVIGDGPIDLVYPPRDSRSHLCALICASANR